MIEVLGICKNAQGDRGLPQNFVFIFKVESGLHGKSENIGYLWRYATDFLHVSSTCWAIWENNGL